MKKILSIIILFLIMNYNTVYASNRNIVTLNKCVDGDTAWFNLEDEKIKARFLAIDTPESTNKIEEYGKEASEFTCTLLTNASTIEIEYDLNSDKLDKYDRHLVWVFIDNELLQEKVVENGLAEVAYLYGDYKYTNILEQAEEIARKNKINIWNNQASNGEYNYIIVLVGIIIILLFIFNKKTRKKIINKTKRKAIKTFKNVLKNTK